MSYPYITANDLLSAFGRLRKASGWKASTQQFELNLLSEIATLKRELETGSYKQGTGSSFILNEQGRLRLIRALAPKDMTVQHALCDSVLNPSLTPYIIHDNGASIKGKGISFTRRRFEQHLHTFFRKYGREGYILKIDFRKFFDNIEHEALMKEICRHIRQPPILELIRGILIKNAVDVTGFETVYTLHNIYNALKHYKQRKEVSEKGKAYLAKSLAIGSPISQISGIYLPSRIDTWCKTVMGCKFYDVYMDDRIIIHHSKEFLWKLLDGIKKIAEELGIHINEKKTQIIKLCHPFTFLKTRYLLTPTGKIIRKIPKDVATRQSRKMRKLARLVVEGKISMQDFQNQYKSWRGDKKRYHAFYTLRRMDNKEKEWIEWIRKNTPSH